MNLTYEELELLIQKVSVGKTYLLTEQGFVEIIHPTNSLKLKANFIYEKSYNQALKDGLLPKKDLEVLIKERGIFSQFDEDQVAKINSQLDAQKIVLSKTLKVKANQDRINKTIKDLEEKRSLLLYKKYSKLYMSAEIKAEEDMNAFLCSMCVYDDNENRFWSSHEDFLKYDDVELKNKILQTFLELIRGIDIKTIRFLARSTIWRIRYNTSAKVSDTLFNKPTSEYTIDQLNLVYWSNYYDNIYNMLSSDRPTDDIIDDDDALDEFMEEYYRQINNETSISKKDKKMNKGRLSAFDSEEVIVTQSCELYYDIKYDKPKEAQQIKDRSDIKKRTKSGR